VGECAEVLRQIEAYCDDALSPAERAEVERHLGGCNPCLEKKEFRVAFQGLVRRACSKAEVPPQLIQRIRSVLDRGS